MRATPFALTPAITDDVFGTDDEDPGAGDDVVSFADSSVLA